jgi:hypothetical protein
VPQRQPHIMQRALVPRPWEGEVVLVVVGCTAALAPPPVPCRVPLLAAHLMLPTHQVMVAAGAPSGPTHPPLLTMSWMR